jgi:hypothetical protein
MTTNTLQRSYVGDCPDCTGTGYELTEDAHLPEHPVAGWTPNRPTCPGAGRPAANPRPDTFAREGLRFL